MLKLESPEVAAGDDELRRRIEEESVTNAAGVRFSVVLPPIEGDPEEPPLGGGGGDTGGGDTGGGDRGGGETGGGDTGGGDTGGGDTGGGGAGDRVKLLTLRSERTWPVIITTSSAVPLSLALSAKT